MTPKPSIRIGVDDFGTETQKCEGWTYFCLPESLVDGFTTEAQVIIDASGLVAFHGQEFSVAVEEPYRQFLKLIRSYQQKSRQALTVNTLLSDRFKGTLQGFADRILPKVLEGANIPPRSATKLLSPYIAPLFTLSRLHQVLGTHAVMQVDMDASSKLKNLKREVHKRREQGIRGDFLLRRLYNAYTEKVFPGAPLLPEHGISVIEDSKSFLIQAADVIGNLSMAHIFTKLGKKTKTREAKAALLKEVYGDILQDHDFAKAFTVVGNDLIMADGKGELRFTICADVD
jgi:hypothetical protein